MNRGAIGILMLADRDWTDQFMTAASEAPRLARDFPVVWVTPPHHWRVAGARRRSGIPVLSSPADGNGLTVYTPPAHLPMTHRPAFIGRWLQARRLRQARGELVRQGAEKIVLYVWRPKYADTLDLVEHDLSMYHIVDEYSFSSDDPPTPPDEQRLIDGVDLLIVHSPALLEKKGRGVTTEFIPNGVDYEAFSTPCPEPADLEGIRRPRIGYCGYLKQQMDWDLLTTLIDRHSEWSWVFVGQVRHDDLAGRLEDLGSRPNVHMLGEKPSRELARYPQHFDVCIMPYVLDDYTRYIYPLKLHEYLASGRPAVGTPIRSLRDFENIIELAEGADEWSAALERSLAPTADSAERIARRKQVAHEHDWDVLTERIARLIERELQGA